MSTSRYEPTPSQTIGPFFRFGMRWANLQDLVDPGVPGALTLRGRVLDGAGDPVLDSMLEIWQADGEGRLGAGPEPGWTGFGRCLVDAAGEFRFTTVKPGCVADPQLGTQAPHIDVSLFARGLNQRLVTRIYFPDEVEANATDPVLSGLEASMRRTLVAQSRGDGSLYFEIRLQGPDETVFFSD